MAVQSNHSVNLSPKIDFAILEAYRDGQRDVPVNVAKRTDQNRSYVNSRYSYLRDYRLLERVGPAETSGLYQITPRGVAALTLREHYGDHNFEALVDEHAKQIEIRPPEIVDRRE